MNAPLPEAIRTALESVTLDDHPPRGWRRSHKCTADGAAGGGGLAVERLRAQEV
ncbi:hypothetical protein [Azohydromonas sediminis]|uniref:hypothetical protein n=1 Tax=Azohydromonas sediminis TaxID=2259674 RepID=UPI0013C35AD3|nr:hypothetical protein [Azohydromonas sediminis]